MHGVYFFGWIQWPGLHWDANYYAPIVLNVGKGVGWYFEGYGPNLIRFPSKEVSGHGILLPLILGSIFKVGSWHGFFKASSIVNATTLVVYAALFRRVLSLRHRYTLLLSFCLAVMAAMIALTLQGRPEHLIPLELTLPFISYYLIRKPARVTFVVAALTAGLIFVTSPLPGVIVGMAFIVLLSLKAGERTKQFWRLLSKLLILATTISVSLISILGPVDFISWLRNSSSYGLIPYDFRHELFKPLAKGDLLWGFTGFIPLWNLLVILIIGIAMLTLVYSRNYFTCTLIAGASVVLSSKAADYTYASLFPGVLLGIFWVQSENLIRVGLPTHFSLLPSKILPAGMLLLSLPYVLGFARVIYQSKMHIHDGTLPRDQVRRLENLASAHELRARKVSIAYPGLYSPSLVSLGSGDSYELISVWDWSLTPGNSHPIDKLEKQEGLTLTYFILPKSAYEMDGLPPEKIFLGDVGFRLLENGWQSREPTMLGATRIPDRFSEGYDVAIYKRL